VREGAIEAAAEVAGSLCKQFGSIIIYRLCIIPREQQKAS
jgi:hypothetical protein